MTVYKGKIVQQTHVVVNAAAGIEMAVRVSAGDSSVQLISQLGPLDISNGYGQEAVMEIRAAIGSDAQFQTDANGLFMMQRMRRTNTSGFFPGYAVMEPESQNYFPATAMASLKTAAAVGLDVDGPGVAVSFISAHGVTSLADGTLEVMMHRRMKDLGCRVDQGFEMDDQHIIVKTLRVQAKASAQKGQMAVANRLDALLQQHPVEIFFAAAEMNTVSPAHKTSIAASKAVALPDPLPRNVHLQTFRTSLTSDLRCRCV